MHLTFATLEDDLPEWSEIIKAHPDGCCPAFQLLEPDEFNVPVLVWFRQATESITFYSLANTHEIDPPLGNNEAEVATDAGGMTRSTIRKIHLLIVAPRASNRHCACSRVMLVNVEKSS